MSLRDERTAELWTKLDIAWQKCLYGKTYSPAYEVARRIQEIRALMPSTLQAAVDPGLDAADFDRMLRSAKNQEAIDPNPVWWNVEPNLNSWQRKLIEETASVLLLGAITASSKLHDVATALETEASESPTQAHILKAYEDCIEGRYPPTRTERGKCFVRCSPPTLAQLQEAFIKRFGQQCWPSRQGVEKMLRTFELPLSKAKRGRPVGSKTKIRNREG